METAVASTLITPRLRRQLEVLDWDFPEYLPGTSEAIHWYPGTFPASLPATLIQALSQPGDIVFEPYGGIGTTAAEGLRLGRKVWLVEHNPIGFLASYVVSGLIILKSLGRQESLSLLDDIRCLVASCVSSSKASFDFLSSPLATRAIDSILSIHMNPRPSEVVAYYQKIPEWNALGAWVEQETLSDIQTLHSMVSDGSLGEFGTLVAYVMLSANLRPASSQIRSWGHIADNVKPKVFLRKNFYQLCLRWLTRTGTIIRKTITVRLDNKSTDQPPLLSASFHNWQSHSQPTTLPNGKATTLITSPPYGGAIDYTLAQRLSLYLFGFVDGDISALTQAEIGARRKRFMASSREDWANDLVNCLDQQIGYLADAATVALVLPHKDASRDIGHASIETHLFERNWKKIFEVDRSIRQIRTRQSWTSIKMETIQVYQSGV